MSTTNQDLVDALRAAPEIIEALLRDCTQEQAGEARGGEEGWSVLQVVCHLRDAEERALARMRAMRDQAEPFLPAYNQEAWASERNYRGDDLLQALRAFALFRSQHVTELQALTPDAWNRAGIHEERGRITIYSQSLRLVLHDLNHAAQIARQLSKGN